MKITSKKKMIGVLAAVLIASTISISAFAAITYPNHDYSLTTGATSGPILYQADTTYMYFNTRPSSGAGGVSLSVSGPGVNSPNNLFPYQVSRSPLKINTSSGIGNYYTVYLKAGSTDVSGKLSVWTSSN